MGEENSPSPLQSSTEYLAPVKDRQKQATPGLPIWGFFKPIRLFLMKSSDIFVI
jgi:hypothetical protein